MICGGVGTQASGNLISIEAVHSSISCPPSSASGCDSKTLCSSPDMESRQSSRIPLPSPCPPTAWHSYRQWLYQVVIQLDRRNNRDGLWVGGVNPTVGHKRKPKNQDGDPPSSAATDSPPPSRGSERSLDSLSWDYRRHQMRPSTCRRLTRWRRRCHY